MKYCEKFPKQKKIDLFFSHLLSTVINNIELIPDYYQRATIPFVIKESDQNYKNYQPDADTVEPVAKKPKIGE